MLGQVPLLTNLKPWMKKEPSSPPHTHRKNQCKTDTSPAGSWKVCAVSIEIMVQGVVCSISCCRTWTPLTWAGLMLHKSAHLSTTNLSRASCCTRVCSLEHLYLEQVSCSTRVCSLEHHYCEQVSYCTRVCWLEHCYLEQVSYCTRVCSCEHH